MGCSGANGICQLPRCETAGHLGSSFSPRSLPLLVLGHMAWRWSLTLAGPKRTFPASCERHFKSCRIPSHSEGVETKREGMEPKKRSLSTWRSRNVSNIQPKWLKIGHADLNFGYFVMVFLDLFDIRGSWVCHKGAAPLPRPLACPFSKRMRPWR